MTAGHYGEPIIVSGGCHTSVLAVPEHAIPKVDQLSLRNGSIQRRFDFRFYLFYVDKYEHL